MSRSERIWRVGLAIAAAVLVIALSLAEGSILGGVVVTIVLFAVVAAVLFAGYLLAGMTRYSGPSAASDWDHDERPAGRLRALAHTLASRPWRAGAGVLTVANAAITGRAGTLVSPRGQRLAATVLYVEFNPRDLAAATARWPAEVLAAEYVAGYVEHARRVGLKRVADETVLYVVADARVPVGRVVVTPAFGPSEHVEVVAEGRAVNTCPPVTGTGGHLAGNGRPVDVANPTVPASNPPFHPGEREHSDLDPHGDVPWDRRDLTWSVPPTMETSVGASMGAQPIERPTMPTRRKEELV